MECNGRIVMAKRDVLSRDILLTIRLDDAYTEAVNTLDFAKDYTITIDVPKKKRSLDANAYFHKLVALIADKSGASKPFIKNFLLGHYGQQEYIDGKLLKIKSRLDPEIMMEREDIHTIANGYEFDDEGEMWTIYKVMRGSHTYTSKEMSILIEGAITQANELGIPTLTRTEMERMVGAWHRS